MNKAILVEGSMDIHFYTRILLSMGVTSDFEILQVGGIGNSDYKKIKHKLNILVNDIGKDKYDKNNVALIIDADDDGVDEKLKFLSKSLDDVEIDSNSCVLNNTNFSFALHTYVVNIDGFGEIESFLKHIASSDACFADCTDSLRTLFKECGKEINEKMLLKQWVEYYHKHDNCSKKEYRQYEDNCGFKVSLNKDIYDFNDPILDDVKSFLTSFMES